jgi:hypothetical protein
VLLGVTNHAAFRDPKTALGTVGLQPSSRDTILLGSKTHCQVSGHDEDTTGLPGAAPIPTFPDNL